MTIIYAAGTAPVNPAGVAGPLLSIAQLWKGLELKVRKPQLFLKVVEDCKVLQDTGDTVLRELQFKRLYSALPKDNVTEYITHFPPLLVPEGPAVGVETFAVVGTASRVQNIVTQGADGAMYLTFTFEWEHPDIAEGSPEHLQKAKEHQAMALAAVARTVEVIRGMVEKGEL